MNRLEIEGGTESDNETSSRPPGFIRDCYIKNANIKIAWFSKVRMHIKEARKLCLLFNKEKGESHHEWISFQLQGCRI